MVNCSLFRKTECENEPKSCSWVLGKGCRSIKKLTQQVIIKKTKKTKETPSPTPTPSPKGKIREHVRVRVHHVKTPTNVPSDVSALSMIFFGERSLKKAYSQTRIVAKTQLEIDGYHVSDMGGFFAQNKKNLHFMVVSKAIKIKGVYDIIVSEVLISDKVTFGKNVVLKQNVPLTEVVDPIPLIKAKYKTILKALLITPFVFRPVNRLGNPRSLTKAERAQTHMNTYK